MPNRPTPLKTRTHVNNLNHLSSKTNFQILTRVTSAENPPSQISLLILYIFCRAHRQLLITNSNTIHPLTTHLLSSFLSISNGVKCGHNLYLQLQLLLLLLLSLPFPHLLPAPPAYRHEPLRRLQNSSSQVCRQVRPRPLLPPNRAPQVHHRPPRLRRQQHHQVPPGNSLFTSFLPY